ncbi:MAG TPA: permease, partial [Polyangia bacterium]
ACQWLDVVFVPLFVAGVETIVPLPGTKGGYGEGIIHADYTHSLVGALLLAALFGAGAAARWGRRAGLVLGAVVLSHWVLDLLVHRHDMPLLPANAGGLPLLGFGLWQFPNLTATVELALVVAGGGWYWRAALAVCRQRGAPMRRAHIAGILTVAFGVVVLALSRFGL